MSDQSEAGLAKQTPEQLKKKRYAICMTTLLKYATGLRRSDENHNTEGPRRTHDGYVRDAFRRNYQSRGDGILWNCGRANWNDYANAR